MNHKNIIRISTVPLSLYSLLNGQLKFLSTYYHVVAISSPGDDLRVVAEREGVRTIAIPMERRISLLKDFISLFRLILLFVKERPDMIHSITPKAGLLSMVAGWVARVPVRMHTFTGLVFPSATGKMQKLLILMDKITCFCATDINPEGEGVRHDLIEWHITKKPLRVIANGNVNGIDTSFFHVPQVLGLAEKIRKQLHITPDVFVFCFVGRMVRDKGVNELIKAFVRIYRENNAVRLFLVGPFETEFDPVLPETSELIFSHEGVFFMDWQQDIRPYLAASDALVFPSYREGFPNVVMQAGAMDLPSIVTNINGCNEIIVDGKNGVIIPPHDENALYAAMKYFIEHPEDVDRMAANARPMIQARYEQKIVWNALLEEYNRLLG